MFNLLQNNTKVLVTTITINNLVARLFTNYNGKKRAKNTGSSFNTHYNSAKNVRYNVFRAKSLENNVFISKAFIISAPLLPR